jgi:hypothetical protein
MNQKINEEEKMKSQTHREKSFRLHPGLSAGIVIAVFTAVTFFFSAAVFAQSENDYNTQIPSTEDWGDMADVYPQDYSQMSTVDTSPVDTSFLGKVAAPFVSTYNFVKDNVVMPTYNFAADSVALPAYDFVKGGAVGVYDVAKNSIALPVYDKGIRPVLNTAVGWTGVNTFNPTNTPANLNVAAAAIPAVAKPSGVLENARYYAGKVLFGSDKIAGREVSSLYNDIGGAAKNGALSLASAVGIYTPPAVPTREALGGASDMRPPIPENLAAESNKGSGALGVLKTGIGYVGYGLAKVTGIDALNGGQPTNSLVSDGIYKVTGAEYFKPPETEAVRNWPGGAVGPQTVKDGSLGPSETTMTLKDIPTSTLSEFSEYLKQPNEKAQVGTDTTNAQGQGSKDLDFQIKHWNLYSGDTTPPSPSVQVGAGASAGKDYVTPLTPEEKADAESQARDPFYSSHKTMASWGLGTTEPPLGPTVASGPDGKVITGAGSIESITPPEGPEINFGPSGEHTYQPQRDEAAARVEAAKAANEKDQMDQRIKGPLNTLARVFQDQGVQFNTANLPTVVNEETSAIDYLGGQIQKDYPNADITIGRGRLISSSTEPGSPQRVTGDAYDDQGKLIKPTGAAAQPAAETHGWLYNRILNRQADGRFSVVKLVAGAESGSINEQNGKGKQIAWIDRQLFSVPQDTHYWFVPGNRDGRTITGFLLREHTGTTLGAGAGFLIGGPLGAGIGAVAGTAVDYLVPAKDPRAAQQAVQRQAAASFPTDMEQRMQRRILQERRDREQYEIRTAPVTPVIRPGYNSDGKWDTAYGPEPGQAGPVAPSAPVGQALKPSDFANSADLRAMELDELQKIRSTPATPENQAVIKGALGNIQGLEEMRTYLKTQQEKGVAPDLESDIDKNMGKIVQGIQSGASAGEIDRLVTETRGLLNMKSSLLDNQLDKIGIAEFDKRASIRLAPKTGETIGTAIGSFIGLPALGRVVGTTLQDRTIPAVSEFLGRSLAPVALASKPAAPSAPAPTIVGQAFTPQQAVAAQTDPDRIQYKWYLEGYGARQEGIARGKDEPLMSWETWNNGGKQIYGDWAIDRSIKFSDYLSQVNNRFAGSRDGK